MGNEPDGMDKVLKQLRNVIEGAFTKEVCDLTVKGAAFVKGGSPQWYPLIKVLVLTLLIDEKFKDKKQADEMYTTIVNTLDMFAEKVGVDLDCTGEGKVFDCKACHLQMGDRRICDVMPKNIGLTLCPAYNKE